MGLYKVVEANGRTANKGTSLKKAIYQYNILKAIDKTREELRGKTLAEYFHALNTPSAPSSQAPQPSSSSQAQPKPKPKRGPEYFAALRQVYGK
jgi:hypothetical protein